MQVRNQALAGVTWLWIAAAAGCSPGTGSGNNGNGVTGAGASAASGSGAASGFGGGAGLGGGTGIDPNSNGGTGFIDPGMIKNTNPNNTGPDGSCASTTATAEQITVQKTVPVTETITSQSPVALYLMQDQSGSMLEPFLPPTKWNMTQNAITAFVQDPASTGIDIALQYFALSTSACDGSGYNVPDVPMALLPGNAQAIITSLGAHFPTTNTPIEPALRGVTQYCAAYKPQQPNERCIAVLITDGTPSSCDLVTADLVKIAADAYTQSNVITFTIGMQGADFSILDAIAAAGHGDCTPNTPLGSGGEACNVSGGGSSFIDSLNTIRATVTTTVTHTVTHDVVQTTKLACEYTMPTPPGGAALDPTEVNVQFTSSTGKEDLYQVANVAACSGTKAKAWYYDDPANPTKILVCPDTCTVLQAASGDGGVAVATAPRVDVLLGCVKTKIAPPA